MYPVEYKVAIWDDDVEKVEKRHGVTFAENYAEAMANIEQYYGDTIIDVKLFMNEECTVYEFEATQIDYNHGMFKVKYEKW